MKRKHVSNYRSRGREYPQIKLRGNWLRDLGYEPGLGIEVEVRSDALMIRPTRSETYNEVYVSSASRYKENCDLSVRDFEVSLQLNRHTSKTRLKVHGPGDIARLCEPLQRRDREVVWSVYLDSKHCISGTEEISVGTLSSSLLHPREVYKGPILANAASLVIVHNHPSGDVRPSTEDLRTTKRLAAAGELLGIRLLDHLILGGGAYTSLREEGAF